MATQLKEFDWCPFSPLALNGKKNQFWKKKYIGKDNSVSDYKFDFNTIIFSRTPGLKNTWYISFVNGFVQRIFQGLDFFFLTIF